MSLLDTALDYRAEDAVRGALRQHVWALDERRPPMTRERHARLAWHLAGPLARKAARVTDEARLRRLYRAVWRVSLWPVQGDEGPI